MTPNSSTSIGVSGHIRHLKRVGFNRPTSAAAGLLDAGLGCLVALSIERGKFWVYEWRFCLRVSFSV